VALGFVVCFFFICGVDLHRVLIGLEFGIPICSEKYAEWRGFGGKTKFCASKWGWWKEHAFVVIKL